MAVTLTLDLFSGRPNPQLRLSKALHKELLVRLDKLAPLPNKFISTKATTLGYRGCILQFEDNLDCLTIYDGLSRHGKTEKVDQDRLLERWLVSLIQHQLDPSAQDYLSTQLGD